ncbi:MAG: ribbon-helix-helix protein, CopG family [Gemmatimonadaceae bacterium]|nr:ribbon-helix-helix protein, CopG family [Gemmatimonadaceae bacterium]
MSFRLSQEMAALLHEAAQAAGLSSGECAREMVHSALDRAPDDDVVVTIDTVRVEIADLRRDLLGLLESLLLNVAHVSREDVRKHLESLRNR